MYRLLRALVLASALTVPLTACSSMSDFSIDPTDWMPDDLFGTKKKLPGERRAVFPQGVPGVEHGVPPDLVKGAQPSADMMSADAQAVADSEQEPAREEPKPKAKPKPKPKPKVAAKPAPVEPQPRATPVTARQPMQQPASTGGTQWPSAPPPSGGGGGGGGMRPSGGVQWPDPPSGQ